MAIGESFIIFGLQKPVRCSRNRHNYRLVIGYWGITKISGYW